MTNIFSVKSGQISYISNADSEQDAAGEIIDNTYEGALMGSEILVTDMMTGNTESFDTIDILQELNFEFEDEE